MLIGKRGEAKSGICTADETSITMRGRDLCNELMGHVSFTEFFFLHVTGQQPTEDQIFFLDAVLVSLAEHGMTPSVQAARMTYAAAPEALQGAVSAGILGCGSVILGSAEVVSGFLTTGITRISAGEEVDAVAHDMVAAIRAAKRPLPGFGHPIHTPVDPRAVRLLQLARERGVAGAHVAFLGAVERAVDDIYPRRLPMNVNAAIPAVALDIDFPLAAIKGISILARTAGLIGHMAEESDRPTGFYMASQGAAAIDYDGG
jgi:citrate synthase